MLRIALGFCIAIALIAGSALGAVQAVTWEPKGPWVDEILFPIIPDHEARLRALRTGEIDLLNDLIRPADIRSLERDPQIDLTINLGYHMFYLGFNFRRTPLGDVAVRRALAHAVDRDALILSVFEGYVLPMEKYVPPTSRYHNPDTDVPKFDPQRARAILDAAGYRMGPDGFRTHPETGEPLREMSILTPKASVAPTSVEIGERIAEAGRSIGLPMRTEALDDEILLSRVLGTARDFDMYLLGWSLGRFPTELAYFFHSRFDTANGYNTTGIRHAPLDAALDRLVSAKDFAAAKAAAFEAQEILSKVQPYLVLYSRPSISAFRTDRVTGYVPMLGFGTSLHQNLWTTLNIRMAGGSRGGVVRWPLPEAVEPFTNPLARSAGWDEIFGRVGGQLLAVSPELNEDTPWEARRWEIGTWTTPERSRGTKVTFWLRDDVLWHDGVPFTAHDVKFSMDYIKAHAIPRYQEIVEAYSHAEVVNDHQVTLYYTTETAWHLYHHFTGLAQHIWQDVEDWEEFRPWQEPHPTVEGLTKLIGRGPFVFREYVPGEYVRLTRFERYWAGLDR